jgi:hypothetical protein
VKMDGRLCTFCGQPVSEDNYQEIVQTKFATNKEGVVETMRGDAPSFFIHSVCELPDGLVPPANGMSERLLPRRVFYVDVGDLPPPDVHQYLARLLKTVDLRKGGEEVFIVPTRTQR